jgi:hypothetical protein
MEKLFTRFEKTAHYDKLTVDQGYARAQYNSGTCLHTGEGVSRETFLQVSKQHIMTNLLMVKDLVLLGTIVDIACSMVKVFPLIFEQLQIVINSLLIKNLLEWSIAMESGFSPPTVSIEILQDYSGSEALGRKSQDSWTIDYDMNARECQKSLSFHRF